MSSRQHCSRYNRTRQVIAVLCLVLVSVVSVAQIAHDHNGDDSAAQHCALCFAAHVTLAKTAAISVSPAVVERVSAIAERASIISLLFTENSYIRPPPVA